MGAIIKLIKIMPELSYSERAIAEYLLKHKYDAISKGVTGLAKHAGSSNASVVRMCKKLGYSGFKDFKIDFIIDINKSSEQVPSNEISGNLLEAVVKNNIKTLNETLLLIDNDAVNCCVELIENAGRIAVFGKGASYIIANDLTMKFNRINVNMRTYLDTHGLLTNIAQ